MVLCDIQFVWTIYFVSEKFLNVFLGKYKFAVCTFFADKIGFSNNTYCTSLHHIVSYFRAVDLSFYLLYHNYYKFMTLKEAIQRLLAVCRTCCDLTDLGMYIQIACSNFMTSLIKLQVQVSSKHLVQ